MDSEDCYYHRILFNTVAETTQMIFKNLDYTYSSKNSLPQTDFYTIGERIHVLRLKKNRGRIHTKRGKSTKIAKHSVLSFIISYGETMYNLLIKSLSQITLFVSL